MKRYLVKKTNHGFRGRYWVEGTIVSFEDDVLPNKHFELITAATKLPVPEAQQSSPATLSQAQTQNKKEPTAAQALKDQSEKGTATKPLSETEQAQLKALDESASGGESPKKETTDKPVDEGQGSI